MEMSFSKLLEPDSDTLRISPELAQTSQTISLKRIADALERQNKIQEAVAAGLYNITIPE